MQTITRRATLGAIAASAMTGAVQAVAATDPTSGSKTFVLVHGGYHGGWCWQRVADRLRQGGHRVYTPTLTGLGERGHLLSANVGMDTHILDVVNTLRYEGLRDVVLVGHSYAGLVISGVAEQVDSIASIIYLDAVVPKVDSSFYDYSPPQVQKALDALVAKGEIGRPPVPAAVFGVNPDDRAWVDSLLTPHPIKSITDMVKISGAAERIGRKTYIRSTLYESSLFDAAYGEARSNPGWQTFTLDAGGHDSMIDEPERLSALMMEAA